MTRAISLSQSELAIVRDILRAHLPPDTRAWVFGSRATGIARRYSDLDIAVEYRKPFGLDMLGQVADALSESDLPFKVDVVDLSTVDPNFRTMIELDMLPLLLNPARA